MKKPMNLIQNLVLGKQEEFLGRNYEKTKTQGFLFCLYRDRYIHIYIQCKFIQREKDKLVGRYAKVYFRIPRIAKTIRMTEIVSLTRNQCPPPNKSISESQKSSETMLIGIFSKVLAPLTSSTCHSALCLYSHLLIHLINKQAHSRHQGQCGGQNSYGLASQKLIVHCPKHYLLHSTCCMHLS